MAIILKLVTKFICNNLLNIMHTNNEVKDKIINFFQCLDFNREPTLEELKIFERILEEMPYFQHLVFRNWSEYTTLEPDEKDEIYALIAYLEIKSEERTAYLNAPPKLPDFELLSDDVSYPKPKPSPVRSEKRR